MGHPEGQTRVQACCVMALGAPSSQQLSGRRANTVAPSRRTALRVMNVAAANVEANGATIKAGGSGTQFLRPHLLKLAAYTPIEPFEILSQRYGLKPEQIVKLDANENPYGPPPEVLAALGSMSFPHIYPDAETRQLRAALAEIHDIPKEHLLVRPGRACMQHGGAGMSVCRACQNSLLLRQ